MAFGNGRTTLSLSELRRQVDDISVASHYLGITKIPCLINSPLRCDKKPSFAIYKRFDNVICFNDFATREHGDIYELLGLLWRTSLTKTIDKVVKDLPKIKGNDVEIIRTKSQPGKVTIHNQVALQCKVREWQKHDIDYWESYGVSLKWLKYADVWPISHKIIIKDDKKYVFGADKYAYAFVERKEGKITLKIYQPFNTAGFKWSNKHDRSVISLWTKLPPCGDKVVICSSLKDALCLWNNTGIPAISVQGEGYGMSETAVNELKRRFKKTYILFDNDKAGLQDGLKLSADTGFVNLILPEFNGGKDVSDLYKVKGKKEFQRIMKALFNGEEVFSDDLPF